MGLFKKLFAVLFKGNQDEAGQVDPFIKYHRIDLGPPKPGHESRPDWGIRARKSFTALAHESAGPEPLAHYLSHISDVVFTLRYSEYFYESEYLLGKGTKVDVIIVPAETQRWLPRRLRQPGWVYVSIGCETDDTRFDGLPGYTLIPVRRYLQRR